MGKIQTTLLLLTTLSFLLMTLTGGEASHYVLDLVPAWVAV